MRLSNVGHEDLASLENASTTKGDSGQSGAQQCLAELELSERIGPRDDLERVFYHNK